MLQILKEYLIENNFDWILKEQYKNENLSELARVKLVAALCDFMVTFFGVRTPQKLQKFTVETADEDVVSVTENNDEVLSISCGGTDTELRDLINDMKSWTIEAGDLNSMKANLRKTRYHRQNMLLNEKTDLLESFPYFFLNIELV